MKSPHLSDRLLAEALPDALIVLTHDLHLCWWNKAAEKFFLLEGTTSVNHAFNLLENENFNDFLITGAPTHVELPSPKVPSIMLSFSLLPYVENQRLLIAKDVTHTYLLENMRQDFIANVSHELRTPLTVLSGYIETLLNHEHDDTKPWKKILSQMQSQSLRMEHLVQDLLLLSRLETDQPDNTHWQKVAVSSLVKTICNDAKALSGDKHQFHINLTEDLYVYGQVHELRSAFSNIIFNAVNYTPAQGHIYIDWYSKGDKAYLQVRDTGIGIEKKHIPRLTQRFYRIDKARSRAKGGTGLGLAIVKHVLIRHQGELIIESTVGKGSSFTCVFPGYFEI